MKQKRVSSKTKHKSGAFIFFEQDTKLFQYFFVLLRMKERQKKTEKGRDSEGESAQILVLNVSNEEKQLNEI